MYLIRGAILLRLSPLTRRQMLPGRSWLRLPLQAMLPIRSGPKLPQEPAFQNPPQWIHEAGQWLFKRREARKRALVRLIDRLPLRKR
jgi:hypothetical protein